MIGESQPTFTVIAGPNGSGKSTLTASIRAGLRAPVIDPDAIAGGLQPEAPERAAIEAGRLAIKRLDAYLQSGTSFAVETTLSGIAMLHRMDRARERGFAVHLIFIGVDTVQTNIDRIAERVARGGHNVPDHDVRRRYARGMRNLVRAIERADRATIMDNSSEMGPREILAIDLGRITARARDLPDWVTAHLGAFINRAT